MKKAPLGIKKNCGPVDTFPVWLWRADARYTKKYSRNVVKFQIVSTNLGMVALLSGPHRGAESDATIYRNYNDGLHAGKFLLGDKAYISCPGVIPPVKQNDQRFSRSERMAFNRTMSHYRTRVEATIGNRACCGKGRNPLWLGG